ncbi:hypothetical protein cyc_04401 [Cyclospora cayetanensis]|uniref:Uncharacterized protein n=1 Tax=Cyclospora cayetanensis TaxID=88456 RepID=A0A1D3CSK9_9EIME|nr:hypothetical protein cyc_04401 [Cyclospora cayetanensis]
MLKSLSLIFAYGIHNAFSYETHHLDGNSRMEISRMRHHKKGEIDWGDESLGMPVSENPLLIPRGIQEHHSERWSLARPEILLVLILLALVATVFRAGRKHELKVRAKQHDVIPSHAHSSVHEGA